jgi:hypothetical protein
MWNCYAGFELDMSKLVSLNSDVVADTIAAIDQDTTITTTTTTSKSGAKLVNELLRLGFSTASAEPKSNTNALKKQVASQLQGILTVLRGRDLSGMSVIDVASTTSDLVGIVDLFGKGKVRNGKSAKSDIGVLITLIAAEFAHVLPEGTTVYASSTNVAIILTNINVAATYTLDIAAIIANTSGAVMSDSAAADANSSTYAGITMTLPSYSMFHAEDKEHREQIEGENVTLRNVDTYSNRSSKNHVGVASVLFSDVSPLYIDANPKSKVLSVKFGLDAKVGTPFADGQFLRYSLPVTQKFNHPSFVFFAKLFSAAQ